MSAKCPLKAAAKAAGLTRYTSSRSCPKGHGLDRLVSSGGCVECAKVVRRESYDRIPDQRKNAAAAARDRRSNSPVATRRAQYRSRLKTQYALTEAQYSAMYADQAGRCAICCDKIISVFEDTRFWAGSVAPPNDLARVDHCHMTNAVRGLLCSNCNLGLGKFQDREEVLLNAVRYLTERRTVQAQPSESRNRFEAKEGRASGTPNELCSRASRREDLSPFSFM